MNIFNKELNIFFICFSIILFVCFHTIFFVGELKNTGNDYSFHYANANGGGQVLEKKVNVLHEIHPLETYENYPPLFKIISSFFAFSNSSFYIFTLFLSALVFPLIFYLVTKNKVIVWFYFSVTPIFWGLDYYGIFPQAIVSIFLVLAIFCKKIEVRIMFLGLSLLTHNSGFFLLLFYYFFNYFPKNQLLACSAFLDPKKLGETKEFIEKKIYFFGFTPATIAEILQFFLKSFNFFFIFAGLKGLLLNDKRLLFFSIFLLLLGFLNPRIWFTLCFVLLLGVNYFWKSSSRKEKYFLIGLSFLLFFLNLWGYHISKINNFLLC